MVSRITALTLSLLLLSAVQVAAHGGRLDGRGCHHDRKNGGYHCHQGSHAGKTFSSKAAMGKAVSGLDESDMPREALKSEKEHQEEWCAREGGVTEFLLDDRSRVDCLTDEYAIEFDQAEKWAEAIGQALFYGIKTNRKSGIVLILKHPDEKRFLKRLKTVTEKHNITVWAIGP